MAPAIWLWPIAGTRWVLVVTANGLSLMSRQEAFETTGDASLLEDRDDG